MSKQDTENCIFCQIANGSLASDIIYSDEQVVAFSDLHPKAKIHKLIIPRQHIATLNEVQGPADAILLHMLKVAQQLAQQLGVAESGYQLRIHCQRGGGQEIFHLHLHLLAN